ncbi:hypothetical protein [Neotabrizicola shimadae]|uniref:Uncharacterized protein n=1 Tax=Neotabrizicola shimadae TaxID=2807096 RepID=A0A8G1EF75_9RHOB|nr:hypothetical protein [Neotabrizicola shimadae]QYZ72268.1 hypothetical protein JO391_21265 [Neotabrizicola shimadae]
MESFPARRESFCAQQTLIRSGTLGQMDEPGKLISGFRHPWPGDKCAKGRDSEKYSALYRPKETGILFLFGSSLPETDFSGVSLQNLCSPFCEMDNTGEILRMAGHEKMTGFNKGQAAATYRLQGRDRLSITPPTGKRDKVEIGAL